MRLASTIVATCLLTATPAAGQCILANPSFEIGGTGGAVCGGWNQFGDVGAVATASHGSRAVRVSGPNSGSWAVSGFWQPQDCAPGERWAITGHVRHPSSRPLAGLNTALVNVEWRDAADNLIAYDSFTVADAASPQDIYLDFDLLSSPAPVGTARARLLVGTLQGPGEPVSDAWFDQVTFASTSPPTSDQQQWLDFPDGRVIAFGGHAWRVKGTGYYGPGPNIFSAAASSVWVDAEGRLHLTLKRQGGNWLSTEVVTEQALGYGDYVLTTVGRLDLLDPQAVLGIFLWEYGPCYDYAYTWWNAYNEIDIEYSRWQDPANDLAQFVAQPYDWPGNLSRFDPVFAAGETVSHAMRWLPNRVEYRVWRGGPDDESPAAMIHQWTYGGAHVPRPEQPRLHLNLWRIAGAPAGDQEVVFSGFRFVPAGVVSAVDDGRPGRTPGAPAGRLLPVAPNPFNAATTLAFTLERPAAVELQVYDLGGRLVRTLVSGPLPAGEHRRRWDGRDVGGRAVPSGVYLCRLAGPDFHESRTMVLLK